MFRGVAHSVFGCLLAMAATTAFAQEPQVRAYKSVGDRSLSVHVFKPEAAASPRPAVLMFHGGGWVAGEPEWTYPAARNFQDLGLVAIPVQYRLSGDGVTPADALVDACDAFAWVRGHAAELGVDPARVAGYGVSAGGHLVSAATLGACPNGGKGADLLLLWSPALDLAKDGWVRRLLGGADPASISPLALASQGGPATVVIQGAADTLTPLRGALAFCEAMGGTASGCRVHSYPGLGHLLTRNLDNQESDFDIDPVARRDGEDRLSAFLVERGYAGR
ncbi:alpha/beta hydrolase [Brevundimonas faecalis]|uniref:alpha/beta hydrolase n=1 Tax=Brevundimonas faecalis TaxID=947378 RepID=UPI00360F48EC